MMLALVMWLARVLVLARVVVLVLNCHATLAWVTRPEHLKGVKDEVKRPEGPPARSQPRRGP